MSAPSSDQPRLRQIDLVRDSDPASADFVRPLLHSRLILLALVFLIVWVARAVIYQKSEGPEYLHVPGVVTPLVVGVILLVLCRVNLSLRQLRIVEALIVATWCVRNAALQYYQVMSVADPAAALGLHVSLPWFTLIVSYGILVPASWKRCAVMALLVAAIPLTLALSFHAEPNRVNMVEMIEQLGVAAGIAIFAAAHMHALTVEAFEARKLGQYHLKRKLGEGGMGEVYLAEHQLLHRPCAIKVIRSDRIHDETSFRRFEREVRTTAQLTHWNIVRIFDFGRARDGTFFCVMEYLPGMDLDLLVERYGPLPCARVVHVLRQVCWALREAHAAGLIHRDIKPTNIILCEQGKVFDVAKLVDFGLVQEQVAEAGSSKLTQDKMAVGTPLYMSPEQISGTEMDGRSDLYSLGAVAYFLLTGHPPFEHDDYRRLFAAHLTEAVPPVRRWCPAVPPDLERVILRCLEKKPADRYADAESLEAALAASAADQWSWSQAEAWWREYVDAAALP